MKIQEQNGKALKPMVVLDFKCDYCGEKLDAVVMAIAGTERRIAKAYHNECWEKHIKPRVNSALVGVN